jgi:1-phosphatidylinositol-3-phosphate 5-kinase
MSYYVPTHPTPDAHLAPFYLREHSKRILRGALYNDSKFLSDINVMDYSLVVGVDSQNNELVVGIVGKLRLSPHSGITPL